MVYLLLVFRIINKGLRDKSVYDFILLEPKSYYHIPSLGSWSLLQYPPLIVSAKATIWIKI